MVENSWFVLIKEICGYTKINKINIQKFGEMIAVEPGGASVQNLIHWMQFFRKGVPSKFDYGCEKN